MKIYRLMNWSFWQSPFECQRSLEHDGTACANLAKTSGDTDMSWFAKT